jgi:hypothetical protein
MGFLRAESRVGARAILLSQSACALSDCPDDALVTHFGK